MLMFVALVTDQRNDDPCPLSIVDGSALKKLMVGFSTAGGGGVVCATFFFPQAAKATSITTAKAQLTRRFVIPLSFLPGILTHCECILAPYASKITAQRAPRRVFRYFRRG